MHSAELRQRFLSFFAARQHPVIPSDSLIPSGDPTVLFTSAGMNQFKDYFLGKQTDQSRAASCQKCLRTGDLEQVGRTASHHSFFEMLGNFSFGDYFKQDAILWAWEFLTGTTDFTGMTKSRDPEHCLALPAASLWISVYEKDGEAEAIWRALGVPAARIKAFGQEDNFWPANAPTKGPNGPCGPCSEIYYDPTGQVDAPTSVEVWNLVFTQFDRQPDGTLRPLPAPNIDTGMGLERLARIVQGAATDYETDLFTPIVEAIHRWPRGRKAKQEQAVFAEWAIADHARAIVFLLAEGVLPSNESRGYVVRMLIRRAYRLARVALDLDRDDAAQQVVGLCQAVEMGMRGSPYEEELRARRATVQRAFRQELEQFSATLETATQRLDELIQSAQGNAISGDDAFKLYDTYGLPLELTLDIAQERGVAVDREGFEAALSAQQARSRAASQFAGDVFVGDDLRIRQTLTSLPAKDDHFIGYESLEAEGTVQGIWDGSQWINEVGVGSTAGVILDRSPFYGEAGGQIGDTGTLDGPKGAAHVVHTTWVDDVLVHHAKIERGRLKVQDRVKAAVDAERRLKIARSHTGTHLLHWALRKVLGPDAVQAGSSVEAERLRFDFSSLSGLHDEQRVKVEALVNERVRLGDAVRADQMRLEEAKRAGALALFGEKYGQRVRVVTIGDYSKELCGGTHLPHTGVVGSLTIVGESSIAAGTRRIEALVGDAAAERQQENRRALQGVANELGLGTRELVPGIEALLDKVKQYEKMLNDRQAQAARAEAPRLVGQAEQVGAVRVVKASLQHADPNSLAMLADAIRAELGEDGVVLLASVYEGRVTVVMGVTKKLSRVIHAGQIVKEVCRVIDGSGGGRPDFAQGGGKDPAQIPQALDRGGKLIRGLAETWPNGTGSSS